MNHFAVTESDGSWEMGIGQTLRSLPHPELLRTLRIETVNSRKRLKSVQILDDVFQSFHALDFLAFTLWEDKWPPDDASDQERLELIDGHVVLLGEVWTPIVVHVLEYLQGNLHQLFARPAVEIQVALAEVPSSHKPNGTSERHSTLARKPASGNNLEYLVDLVWARRSEWRPVFGLEWRRRLRASQDKNGGCNSTSGAMEKEYPPGAGFDAYGPSSEHPRCSPPPPSPP